MPAKPIPATVQHLRRTRIRDARRKAGLSQAAAAAKAGMTQSDLSRIERTGTLGLTRAKALAPVLDVTVPWILVEESAILIGRVAGVSAETVKKAYAGRGDFNQWAEIVTSALTLGLDPPPPLQRGENTK